MGAREDHFNTRVTSEAAQNLFRGRLLNRLCRGLEELAGLGGLGAGHLLDRAQGLGEPGVGLWTRGDLTMENDYRALRFCN